MDESYLVHLTDSEASAMETSAMKTDNKQVKLRTWEPKEIARMKEIVHNLGNVKPHGRKSAIWREVSAQMKIHGFDRQPAAIYAKWRRATRKSTSASCIWDVSDSDEEDEEDEEDAEELESENRPKRDLKDSDKPWALGNNWSDQESEIAYQCIKGQRDKEREWKIEPISADQLWRMVSESLESQGFYRRPPNVLRYWDTKGKEKYNFDARTPSIIEKRLGGITRSPTKQLKRTPWNDAVRQYDTSNSITGGSNKGSVRQGSSEATLGNAQPLDLTPHQLAILKAEYARFSYLDNPVWNRLALETGLDRGQIQAWYKNQRATDPKEAELQTKKEPSNSVLKHHRASDVGFQRQQEEKPAKKIRHSLGSENIMEKRERASVDSNVQNKAFDYHPTVAGLDTPPDNHPSVSTIRVQQPSPPHKSPEENPDHTLQMNAVLSKECEMLQKKILEAEENHRQLKLAIAAHRERAQAELKAAEAKEKELPVQEEIQQKAKKRIANINIILDE